MARRACVMEIASVIQGVTVLVIFGAIAGLIKQTNELTRISEVMKGLEKRVERLEGS